MADRVMPETTPDAPCAAEPAVILSPAAYEPVIPEPAARASAAASGSAPAAEAAPPLTPARVVPVVPEPAAFDDRGSEPPRSGAVKSGLARAGLVFLGTDDDPTWELPPVERGAPASPGRRSEPAAPLTIDRRNEPTEPLAIGARGEPAPPPPEPGTPRAIDRRNEPTVPLLKRTRREPKAPLATAPEAALRIELAATAGHGARPPVSLGLPPPPEPLPVQLPRVDPRDATRGGVNVAAVPRKTGRESPLSVDLRDATRGGVNVAAVPRKRGRESPLSIDLPAVMVWPDVSGRAALAALGAPVRVVSRPASWAPGGAVELACGDGWSAHSSPALVFADLDDGRPALLDAAHWQARLTHLTPPGRTYALSPEGGGVRLWVLTPVYRTVWTAFEEAFARGDRTTAAQLARSGLEAVDELRARDVAIADLDHIAVDDPVRFLGTPWTPWRDRLTAQLERLFAAAVL